ncbi:MAG TPA: GerMN domain-containing protein [Geomonas sp.]|nr:GerMN domain-containing protein [Geomonas sp.]
MRKIVLLSVGLIACSLLFSCNKKQEFPAAKAARVSATKSFEKYFGAAPTTDKGTCYAFVIYFPSAKFPGKVVPFPFFTFDEASLKKVAVQRLIGGMSDVKSYQGEILQPFPAGTHLLGITETAGVVTVNFSTEFGLQGNESSDRAVVNALVLTLRQFGGVSDVRIQADGKEFPAGKVSQPTDQDVLQPSQPRLLSVTAMKEKGAREVEEVNAFFDRPVNIRTLRLAGPDGKPFRGDIYQSVFDMAGVMKPKDPALFKAGMPVKVRWDVTDKLGRNSAGDTEIPLEVKEH